MKTTKKELQTGDVLHCRRNTFIAKCIKLFTKSRFNHTAMVVEIWGVICIIDSQNDGTNIRTFEQWKKKYNYKYEVTTLNLSDQEKREMSKKALSMVGVTKYDFVSLLIWQPMYILFGKWHGKKNASANKRMYCSEFVAWVLGLDRYWALSPQDVFEELNTV